MALPQFFPTAKRVLVKPEEFFDKDLSGIRRWQQPIMYLFFLTIIGSFFISKQVKLFFKQATDMAVQFFGIEEFTLGLPASAPAIAGLFLLLVFVLLLATSFKYWVAHWYIKLWNPEATFKRTYAVLTYGGTPGWLAMPFSWLALYLFYESVKKGDPANWLLTILATIVWIGFEGYSIYLRIYALAKVQHVKKWQAVLSVYVFGLLTYLVGVLVIEFIIVSLVLLLLLAFGVLPA
ncbi:YIP1 family protein [Candidatus Woesearchaeota archaeon]|nr:YIP1 family protein [Candidatus Woesearchaeota archaeon]